MRDLHTKNITFGENSSEEHAHGDYNIWSQVAQQPRL